jgi:hypothetical protein
MSGAATMKPNRIVYTRDELLGRGLRLGLGLHLFGDAEPLVDASKLSVETVANGGAELAVFTLNVLVPCCWRRRLRRRPLRAALPEATKAFVAYLMSQPAIAVIKAKGMNPV